MSKTGLSPRLHDSLGSTCTTLFSPSRPSEAWAVHGEATRLGRSEEADPRLCCTTIRGVGWHADYQDPDTGVAKKHRFAVETEAKVAYTQWQARRLAGDDDQGRRPSPVSSEHPAETAAHRDGCSPQEHCLIVERG
ncbi:MAG: hypothetical protein JJU33_08465 [Phycisphaerales bacterium]|nr:hypothetical protein [Phycisphaerales bacterium]